MFDHGISVWNSCILVDTKVTRMSEFKEEGKLILPQMKTAKSHWTRDGGMGVFYIHVWTMLSATIGLPKKLEFHSISDWELLNILYGDNNTITNTFY